MLDACTQVECNSSGSTLEVKLLECNSPPALWVILKNHDESPYDFVITEDIDIEDPTGKSDYITFHVSHQSHSISVHVSTVVTFLIMMGYDILAHHAGLC